MLNRTVHSKSSANGFTLLECILALAISAVLLSSVVTAFAVARKSWKTSSRRAEAVAHARVAMARMARELRYAEKPTTCCASSTLSFRTRYLLDDDDDVEEVTYNQMGMQFYRSQEGGSLVPIAGSYEDNISMLNFEKIAYKKDASGNLVELGPTDELYLADALWVRLNFLISGMDEGSTTMRFETLVGLRNADPG